MFSRALFKQSCKANGTMWAIVTFAVCFMLACVMIISGSGNISGMKNAVQDTIVRQEIESSFESRAISYYDFSSGALENFDVCFSETAEGGMRYLGWLSQKPQRGDEDTDETYGAKLDYWQSMMPDTEKFSEGAAAFVASIIQWQANMPVLSDFNGDISAYQAAMSEWQSQSPANVGTLAAAAYADATASMQSYIVEKVNKYNRDIINESDEKDESDLPLLNADEYIFLGMCVLNPPVDEDSEAGNAIKDFYDKTEENGDSAAEHYDVASLLKNAAAAAAENKTNDYMFGSERSSYRTQRAAELSARFIAVNLTDEANINAMLAQLASYGVNKEKYDSFGYDYKNIKHIAVTSEITFRSRIEYEFEEITKKYTDSEGNITDAAAFEKEKAERADEITAEITSSLLASLPDSVGDALKEIGEMDLYSMVVGSIYYKLAGLLLPIIYVIMAANNLIAGQVDSGSMAYVLSTSVKRRTVVFTQAVYLIGSLFAMFCLTTVTSCICLAALPAAVSLTYGQLILLNTGAFCVLLCLSGLCFLTSCWFDRSKRSMAIGGGLSIFALVASMLGLFGSPILPSIVRMSSLNYFNYVTVISLFDVVSITEGTMSFIWKLAVLAAAGIACYVIGARKFVKKDLPL